MAAKTKYVGALAAAAGTIVAEGLLLLIMLVGEVRTAEAILPGKNGKIAYLVFDGHDYEIFTIKVTGGKPFQVTHNRTDDSSPSWGVRP
jgi:hypothetical protein